MLAEWIVTGVGAGVSALGIIVLGKAIVTGLQSHAVHLTTRQRKRALCQFLRQPKFPATIMIRT
jgi:hypothetical protein